MAKCDIEAADLGLNENDRAIVDEQIKKARGLKKEKLDIANKKEAIKNMIESTKELKETFNYESYEDKGAVKDLEKRIKSLKEEEGGANSENYHVFDKMHEDLRDLKNTVIKNKATSAEMKKNIDSLKKNIKFLSDRNKSLTNIEKEVKNNLINKIVSDDLKGARSSIITQKLRTGEVKLHDLLAQSHNPDSLYPTGLYMKKRVSAGILPYSRAVRASGSENNLESKELNEFINKIKSNISNEAKKLDIEDEFSSTEQGYHPVSFNHGILVKMLDKVKGVSRLNDIKSDAINAFGKEELERMITQDYTAHYKGIQGEITIPTIDNAFKDFEDSIITGENRILKFNNVKFLSDDAAQKFIRKYTGQSIASNYAQYADSASKTLSSYQVFGRRYPDNNFLQSIMKITKTQKQLKELTSFRDCFFGMSHMHSSQMQKLLENLSKVQNVIAMSRATSLALSPFGDEMIGATIDALRGTRHGGFLNTVSKTAGLLGQGIRSVATGGALKHAFSPHFLNDTDEFFRTWHTHAQYRFSYSLGDDSGKGMSGLAMHYFDNIDNGLRAGKNKLFTKKIRNNSSLSFDELKSKDHNLYSVLSEDHSIDSDDWDRLSTYSKTNDFLDASDFRNDMPLMRKIVSMEYKIGLDAIPTGVVTSDTGAGRLLTMMGGNVAGRFFGMFWNFFGKSLAYSWRVTQAEAKYGSRMGKIGTFVSMTAIGGMIPNLAYTWLYGFLAGRKPEDILNDKGSYIDAALGPIGRAFPIASALFFNQSSLGYMMTSSPSAQMLNQSIQAAVKTGKYVNGNHDVYPTEAWLKAVFNIIPFAHGTVAETYALHKTNPHYQPRRGEDAQDWIQNN